MNSLNILISIVGPFLYTTALTVLFIYIFRKKYNFQTILPIALISTTLFIFLLTAIFHIISLAFGITVLACLAIIPLFIIDKNKRDLLKNYIFTPGFVIYTLLYIFIVALSWNKVIPLLSDSSMHWAPAMMTGCWYTMPRGPT